MSDLISIRGIVHTENNTRPSCRLAVELMTHSGMLSGTFTEADGSFLLGLAPAALAGVTSVRLRVYRGATLLRQLALAPAALRSTVWVPITERIAEPLTLRGRVRWSDGVPAVSRRVRVHQLIPHSSGQPIQVWLGEGRTDQRGEYAIRCTSAATPDEAMLRIQALDMQEQPAGGAVMPVPKTSQAIVHLTLPAPEGLGTTPALVPEEETTDVWSIQDHLAEVPRLLRLVL